MQYRVIELASAIAPDRRYAVVDAAGRILVRRRSMAEALARADELNRRAASERDARYAVKD